MAISLSLNKLWGLPLVLLSATSLPLTHATAAILPPGVLAPPADTPVQGRVTDDKGNPLPGATVVLKGANGVGASADADGRFSLNVPDTNATLVISSVGYVSQEVRLAGRSDVTVQLVTD